MRRYGEKGQAVILLAVSMIALVAIVGLAIDGGMLYWNQRRAQNGADAAAIAGTTALVTQLIDKNYACLASSEQPILSLIREYADKNEVPDAEIGRNVITYYLTRDVDNNLVDLPNPSTGKPWIVGEAGHIPCDYKIAGLHVKASFPQDTFLAGIVGIAETNVTVDAYATYEHRTWCTDFAVFGISTDRGKGVVSITGAGTSVTNGGLHSNGGMQLGGGGQGIHIDYDRPVEYDTGGDTGINPDKINEDEPNGLPSIKPVDNYPLPDGFFYRFEDFARGGFIWNEIDPSKRFDYSRDITESDMKNPDGSLRDGLYVTTGSIKLNGLDNLGDTDRPWRVTLVAKGEVQVSGGINQLPLARGVFIFTLSPSTSSGAVKLSGSSNKWAGLIAAPNGDINMSAAHNSDLAGMIIGNRIDISGSNNHINHRPEFCPPNPPRVLLVK
jgi:hypothetical protein